MASNSIHERKWTREQNATHLTSMLRETPGINPAKMYEGCTRNAYHLYMYRYDKGYFANVPRAKFVQALRAEGIPCSTGYSPLNKSDHIKKTLESRAFNTIYGQKRLADWQGRNQCPANEKLCEEAVWFGQTMLLGTRRDMDQIAEAIHKIHQQAASLA